MADVRGADCAMAVLIPVDEEFSRASDGDDVELSIVVEELWKNRVEAGRDVLIGVVVTFDAVLLVVDDVVFAESVFTWTSTPGWPCHGLVLAGGIVERAWVENDYACCLGVEELLFDVFAFLASRRRCKTLAFLCGSLSSVSPISKVLKTDTCNFPEFLPPDDRVAVQAQL
jgi:hypothetical protein